MYLILAVFVTWLLSWVCTGVYHQIVHKEFNYEDGAVFNALGGAFLALLSFFLLAFGIGFTMLDHVPYHRGGYAIAQPFDPSDKLKDLPTICRDDAAHVYRYYIRREDRSFGQQAVDIDTTRVYFDRSAGNGMLTFEDSEGHWDDWGYRFGQHDKQRAKLHVPEEMEFKPC